MNLLYRLSATLLFAVVGYTSAADLPAVSAMTTVPALDVPRYMGRWYEIAKFPNRFQKQCVANTSAEYSIQPDGFLKVLNRCQLENGSVEVAEGAARQPGGPNSPKLEVRFAPSWLSFLPMVWGNYWVIDLDANYQVVAVSEPKREFLWILSRTPQVDASAYAALLARLRMQGLDTEKLVRTRQSP